MLVLAPVLELELELVPRERERGRQVAEEARGGWSGKQRSKPQCELVIGDVKGAMTQPSNGAMRAKAAGLGNGGAWSVTRAA